MINAITNAWRSWRKLVHAYLFVPWIFKGWKHLWYNCMKKKTKQICKLMVQYFFRFQARFISLQNGTWLRGRGKNQLLDAFLTSLSLSKAVVLNKWVATHSWVAGSHFWVQNLYYSSILVSIGSPNCVLLILFCGSLTTNCREPLF